MKTFIVTFTFFVVPAISLRGQSIDDIKAASPLQHPESYIGSDASPSGFATDEDYPVMRFHNSRTQFNGAGFMSSFGIGSRATMNMRTTRSSFTQLSGGFISIPSETSSNISRSSVLGSIVQLYYGKRMNLHLSRSNSFEWTQYASFGLGPVIGIQYPTQYVNVWDGLTKLGFRWGGGAFAGLGSELRLDQHWGAFAQLELDGIGFLSPLLGRQFYLGPSFALGFQFFTR